ncbi:TonB-dependent receptor [Geofilum rubicundum JCM 15548]|uniref:TonB-dependent receptor n=1 Tax=Geofilum rubicundum JCM 15548 TaxID=1236989 RepID=A0A0E9LS57_9BACT|nr:TonB-dependent receptor [Geofilum rubicundum JCM 15548]
MANVDILTSAEPGAKSSIRIRGTSSLNASSEPLIVVDGVPYPTTIADDFSFSTANDEDFGALVNISPNDIASIEVLKDAAATAVWGSRGANGVLLINTKKGRSGKTRFSFSSKYDVRNEASTIPMLNASQYVAMIQDAVWNTVNDLGFSNSQSYLSLLFDTPEIGFDPNWIYFKEYNQDVDYVDEITQRGFSSDNSFSMTGGGDRANYRLSLGYLNEEGTTIGSGFERLSALLSINYRFSHKLRITTDFSFSDAERSSYWHNPRGQALTKMPNMSPYYMNEDGTRSQEYFTPNSYFQGTLGSMRSTEIKGGVFNPVAMVHESINNTNSSNSRFVFNLNYNLLRGLDFFSVVGLDIRKTKNKRFLPQTVTGVTWIDPWFNRSADMLSDNVYLNTENRLLFRRGIENLHNFIATGIVQTSESVSANYKSEVSGNASASTSDPTAGGTIADMGSGSSKSRQLGFIGNLHYAFLDRYMINMGYRFEANSTMGANNRWAGFPTLGLAWHANEEWFLRDLEWWNTFKVRLSWGQSGNAPSGSYSYIGTFDSLNPGYIDYPAIEPNSIHLNNLKWETVSQGNLGVDLAFLKDRLRTSFDVYNKLTVDMLQKNIVLPESSGHSKINWYNSGEMRNSGWEYRIDYDVVRNSNWTVSANFNISQNENEVLTLPDNLTDYKYSFENGAYAYQIVEGNPLGSFYGYKYLGVYQNADETYARDAEGQLIQDISGDPVLVRNGGDPVYPGDAKYQDVNGDGVIDQFDIVYLGNSMPAATGGAGLTVRYKSLTVNAFLHGRAGQKAVNQTRIDTENMHGVQNQSAAVLRRWRHEGDDTDIPRALYNKGYNYLGSDRFVEDASFLRLKTLSLKYSVPSKFLDRFGVERLDAYTTIYDIFTWTNYTGQDPEVPLSRDDGVAYLIAKDKAYTPKPVRIAFGINLNF